MLDIHDLYASEQYRKHDANPFRDIVLHDSTGGLPPTRGDMVSVELRFDSPFRNSGWLATIHLDARNPARRLCGYYLPVFDTDADIAELVSRILSEVSEWNCEVLREGVAWMFTKPEKEIDL